MPTFAGIDWGATHHQVAVVDDAGIEVFNKRHAHTCDGVDALIARLVELPYLVGATGRRPHLESGLDDAIGPIQARTPAAVARVRRSRVPATAVGAGAEEVQRQYGQDKGDRGDEHDVEGAVDPGPPRGDHAAPTRCGRGDPEAEEAEGALGDKHDRGEGEGVGRDRPQDAGHDVAHHDAEVPGA
jgi:hypothetical protein